MDSTEVAGVPRIDLRIHKSAAGDIEWGLVGQGRPTLVLEAGLSDDVSTWSSILAELAARTSVFLYNRPGYGRSAPRSTSRHAANVSGELRGLLQDLDIAPKYVWMGHSWGGLIAQMCAASFPDETAGLILIDAVPPEHIELLLNSADGEAFRAAATDTLTGSALEEFKVLAAPGGGRAVDPPPPYAGPTFILTGLNNRAFSSEHRERRLRLAAEAAAAYPQAERRLVACGHYIHQDRPLAILDAVDEILARQQVDRDDAAFLRSA
jgi:pimeloyl-ACP methyl ester carboxylesterase